MGFEQQCERGFNLTFRGLSRWELCLQLFRRESQHSEVGDVSIHGRVQRGVELTALRVLLHVTFTLLGQAGQHQAHHLLSKLFL